MDNVLSILIKHQEGNRKIYENYRNSVNNLVEVAEKNGKTEELNEEISKAKENLKSIEKEMNDLEIRINKIRKDNQ